MTNQHQLKSSSYRGLTGQRHNKLIKHSSRESIGQNIDKTYKDTTTFECLDDDSSGYLQRTIQNDDYDEDDEAFEIY